MLVFLFLKNGNYLAEFLEAISKNYHIQDIDNYYGLICEFIDNQQLNKSKAIGGLNKLLFRNIQHFNRATEKTLRKGTFIMQSENFSTNSTQLRK